MSREPRSLRPKRAARGKYREMLGIGTESEEAQEGTNAAKTSSVILEVEQDNGDGDKVILMPIVVSEEGSNGIEIEIAGRMEEETAASSSSLSKLDDPMQHIDQIVAMNDQLMESMPEGPSFKKRRRAPAKENNVENAVSKTVKPPNNKRAKQDRGAGTKDQEPKKNFSLNLDMVKEMMLRILTKDEESKVEAFLKEGKLESVLDLLLSSEAENRIRQCVECRQLVEGNDETYAAHYAEAHPQCADGPAFVCEMCGSDVPGPEPSNYYAHLKEHLQQPANAFWKKKTKNESGDDQSGEGEGSAPDGAESGELFVCDLCGKRLKHQKSLYSHRRTHTDAKAVCHICGATLKSARYLHHHLLLHKDVEKPHKCDKCHKAFLSSSALKVHHYYNHEEHPGRFQCTICGKNFKAKQGLQFHMDSHSSELRYECSYCQKRFRGFKTCRVHEMRHREASEPNKFSCTICGKLFKTRQTLKNHEDVHASFNRYQCSLCEKRFKLRKSCLAHIRVHHTDHDRAGGVENSADPPPTTTGEAGEEEIPQDEEGEMAVESLLAEGEEYVVTLEEDDGKWNEDEEGAQEVVHVQSGQILAILPATDGDTAGCDETVETIIVEC